MKLTLWPKNRNYGIIIPSSLHSSIFHAQLFYVQSEPIRIEDFLEYSKLFNIGEFSHAVLRVFNRSWIKITFLDGLRLPRICSRTRGGWYETLSRGLSAMIKYYATIQPFINLILSSISLTLISRAICRKPPMNCFSNLGRGRKREGRDRETYRTSSVRYYDSIYLYW